MGHTRELKCLEPLIAVVNLFHLGYDSDHFMHQRTKNMAYSSRLECLAPLTVVVNLSPLCYDSDHFMLERTQKYGLQSRVKMFTTSHSSCKFVLSWL